MHYRISNTAKRGKIEEEFGIPFKYPKIYRPQQVINGLDEVTIPLVLKENPDVIRQGIWGILPENYREDWYHFQNSFNTLNLRYDSIKENNWLRHSLLNRRCLIIANGYFTSYLYNGQLYPYYVYMKGRKPFAMAGLYNVLEDGFVTSSVLIGKADPTVRQIQNLDDGMPVILGPDQRDLWLQDIEEEQIAGMLNSPRSHELLAHPIARQLFNQNIGYTSMLEPVFYKNLPIEFT